MNKKFILKAVSLILGGIILFSSCASTTLIQSTPSGAKVYLDGEAVGETPYSLTDTKIVGSTTEVRLEKQGYKTFNTSISRNEKADVGAIIGGLLVLVPFLWTMKYKPTHTYELSPAVKKDLPTMASEEQKNSKSKAYRLRELKSLLDEDVITKEEYKKEKKKILEE